MSSLPILIKLGELVADGKVWHCQLPEFELAEVGRSRESAVGVCNRIGQLSGVPNIRQFSYGGENAGV